MRSSKAAQCDFLGGKCSGTEAIQKKFIPPMSFYEGNSKWQTQNPSKSFQIPPFEAKRQQYTAGKVIQGFSICSDIQCIAIDEANLKW